MAQGRKEAPAVVVIGGPNGAGKTTISRALLADTLGITEFVNADTIAAGLSGFEPERAAMAAGRVMLGRLRDLAAARASFAFESTLSSRTFAPWLSRLADDGYEVSLVYIWLRPAGLAVRRVRARVRRGGHHIPEADIRLRFGRSAANLFRLYIPLAERSGGVWRIFDNSGEQGRLIACGGAMPAMIEDKSVLDRLREVSIGGEEDTDTI